MGVLFFSGDRHRNRKNFVGMPKWGVHFTVYAQNVKTYISGSEQSHLAMVAMSAHHLSHGGRPEGSVASRNLPSAVLPNLTSKEGNFRLVK